MTGALWYEHPVWLVHLRKQRWERVQVCSPALVFLHLAQHQIPTAVRFIPYVPQKSQKNLECCDTSCFFTTLRREAPAA